MFRVDRIAPKISARERILLLIGLVLRPVPTGAI